MILSGASAEFIKFHIPDGAAGIRATLKIMAAVVRQFKTDLTIRNFAANLVGDLVAGNFRGEVDACFRWVRDNIRYLNDINGVETLQAPPDLLESRQGDCDDKATLLAALLESIGHPCRFVAAGYNMPGAYEHVWLETLIGREWVACETTMQVDLGWCPMPPNVSDQVFALMRGYI